MLGVNIYIQGTQIELFKDETIELNSSVQNINDISKTFSDFTQSFTVPTSDINNRVFQHYYDSDVDGNFNPNIRVPAFIEIGSLPFKFGVIQLEDVKLKNMMPSSYNIRFFSKVVNLSDLFGEEELTALDFSELNHEFTPNIVFNSLNNNTLINEALYYPLISSTRNFQIGTANADDITTTLGAIDFKDLKPAIKLIRIIEAIEQRYNVSFTKEFLNRAVFGNLFMWCYNNANFSLDPENATLIDFTTKGNLEDISGVTVNLTDNFFVTDANVSTRIKITPLPGFENVDYTMVRLLDGESWGTFSGRGTKIFQVRTDNDNKEHSFVMQTVGSFGFTFEIFMTSGGLNRSATMTSQTISEPFSVSANMPKMKVKDFISSLIKMFNLVLIPNNDGSFKLIPLDEFYSEGKLIDITKYIDTKDWTIKRPKLFKRIEFKHQKSGQILNQQFRDNNGLDLGYGDLASQYDIDGGELKIETQFENLMFERLTNQATDEVTNVQVGKSIDKDLKPYLGKPYIFYRSGFQFYDIPIKCKDFGDVNYTWLTSTENDSLFQQVTGTINFSSDISTFIYQEIENNLFNIYWKDYISDLYSTKRRLISLEAFLPIGKIIQIKLNDVLKIGDKPYIINSMKTNLTTGKVSFELLNYIGPAFSSVTTNIPLTADTIEYSADTELLTADMNYLYIADATTVVNGVQFNGITVSPSEQDFDIKITANQPYDVIKVNTGSGVNWVELDNFQGIKTAYLKVKVARFSTAITNPTALRIMRLDVSIGSQVFEITIIQTRLDL